MATPLPPGTPPLSPATVMRTPIPVQNNEVRIQEKGPWGIFLNLLYGAVLFLLKQPVSLSGLFADLPDATKYPENSRYWSTNTTTEYIVIYSVPGDPATAAWIAM